VLVTLPLLLAPSGTPSRISVPSASTRSKRGQTLVPPGGTQNAVPVPQNSVPERTSASYVWWISVRTM
jgi:hypothetical protein